MSTNNQGMGGVKIEHIALEAATHIGMQAPNTFLGVREADDRVFLPTLKVGAPHGCKVDKEPHYTCDPVDTSSLIPGGKYTLGVGNKWTIRVGGGGIYTETLGPIMTDGEIVVNNIEKGFFVQTKLFQVIAKKRVFIGGKRGDLHFDNLYIQGNTTFFNNVTFNGGTYINGELMCNHITTQKMQCTTEFNDDIKSYINPAMSFHIYNGESLAALKYVREGLLSGIWTAIDWTDIDEKLQGGMVDIELFVNLDPILQLLPGLGEIIGAAIRQIHIPCKIAFPKGISLISDASDFENPSLYTLVTSKQRTPGEAVQKSDTMGPGHQHAFQGPAVKYVDNTMSIYEEAKKITENTPMSHAANCPNGAASFDDAMKNLKSQGESAFKKYSKKFLDWCNPFSSATDSASGGSSGS